MSATTERKRKAGQGRRVQVTFSDDLWSMLEALRGRMGDTDAELIRSIVRAWLSEKSLVSEFTKRSLRGER